MTSLRVQSRGRCTKVLMAITVGGSWLPTVLNRSTMFSANLTVVAIIEDTNYKCVSLFVERRDIAVACSNGDQLFSTRVHKKLMRRIKKTKDMVTVPFGHHGEFQVTLHEESLIRHTKMSVGCIHIPRLQEYSAIGKNKSQVRGMLMPEISAHRVIICSYVSCVSSQEL